MFSISKLKSSVSSLRRNFGQETESRLRVGDSVKTRDEWHGIVIRVSYTSKNVNWLRRMLGEKDIVYTVAHFTVTPKRSLVTEYGRGELIRWTLQDERDKKLKKLGI